MKLKYLQNQMKENEIQSIFIDNPKYVDYFTGYYTEPHERIAALIAFHDSAYLFVPEIEKSEAENSSNLPIITYRDEENPWLIMQNEIFSKYPLPDTFGIEEKSLIVQRYFALRDLLPQVNFVSINSIIQKMIVLKDQKEIDKMNEAGRLADQALAFGFQALNVGVSEQEVVASIEYQMKKLGVDQMSFSTMVLFGDHAASPHGVPGDRQLKDGELVLFDLGVDINGYTSDVSRTVVFGEVSEEIKTIYQIVLQAQKAAQNFVKPGVKISQVDAEARRIIKEAGYGEYFTHRLGHGLGKSVHENPSISSDNEEMIKEGMCFSIEPGIYIEGKVGIRIEDCIHVTENGAEPFTHTNKEWTNVKTQ